MSHTNKTPYADLPQFEPNDKPTWLGDVNNAMLEIDSELSKQNTENLSQNSKINEALQNALEAKQSADAAKQTADEANAGVETLNSKLPVDSSNIADGSVTASKLDSTALNAILKGLTIRRFDADDPNADNAGLSVPDNDCKLRGFYVEEIGLLVINNIADSEHNKIKTYTTPNFFLPTYVRRPSEKIEIASCGVISWKQGQDFAGWTGVAITPNGGIAVNSTNDEHRHNLISNIAVYLGSGQGVKLGGDAYTAYQRESGVF